MLRPVANPPSRFEAASVEWDIPPEPAKLQVFEDDSAPFAPEDACTALGSGGYPCGAMDEAGDLFSCHACPVGSGGRCWMGRIP